MEKKEFIRNAKEAAAFLQEIVGLTGKNKLSEQQIELKKVAYDDAPNCSLIVWCYQMDETKYIGVTAGMSVINFAPSRIINWLPYNGEKIAPNQLLLFDLSGKAYIETLLIPNGNDAIEILKASEPTIQGSLVLISGFHFPDASMKYKKLQYFWAMRIDLHYYHAVSPFTGKIFHITNFGDELKEVHQTGQKIGEYYVLNADTQGDLSLQYL